MKFSPILIINKNRIKKLVMKIRFFFIKKNKRNKLKYLRDVPNFFKKLLETYLLQWTIFTKNLEVFYSFWYLYFLKYQKYPFLLIFSF